MKKPNIADWIGIGIILAILLTFLTIPTAQANDWGKTGHRIVGEIAERQLTDDVKEIIYDILDGESLSSVSTWADEMRSNPNWRPYDKWHYVNLPLDLEYPDVDVPEENVVTIIQRCVSILKSPMADKEMKKFYLKYLVHLVGDLHQPMHTGRYEDYGGSKIPIKFKGRKGSDVNTNLHVLWDSNLIDDFKMSFTEWSNHLENKYRKFEVKQSNVLEWTFESHWWARDIYKNTPPNSYLSYDYVYKYQPVLEKRLYQAGVRLGNLINDIFGE
jgi:hypothetical protein